MQAVLARNLSGKKDRDAYINLKVFFLVIVFIQKVRPLVLSFLFFISGILVGYKS